MAMEDQRLDKYTKDGTVDLKGNLVIRSKRGGWRACSFLVVYEVLERMSYCGIASNLILYFTTKLHQGTVSAANNVTNWVGTTWITPILGAYIADAHLGRYWTFVIASAIYLMGMSLLTLSVSVPGLRPPPCPTGLNATDCKKPTTLQLAVFYCALYILAVGTGGTKPNISTIGADQFDEFEPKEKAHKLSFFNWWMFTVFFGLLFGNTLIVYTQENLGWALGYGLPTLGLAISVIVFLAGTPFYRHRKPSGSPFTRMLRVIVAAVRKWRVPIPSDSKELYELDLEEYIKGKFRIDSTPTLRFLNKASVKTDSNSPWMLCPVTHVEETKLMLRMMPVLIATFIPSTMIAQVPTLFVKQATTLHRNFGTIKIPSASLGAFVTLSMLISIILYDRLFIKIVRKWTKNPRGVTLLQRMGIGLVLQIIIMIIASFTERYRLRVARQHGLDTLSVFILLPQNVLMGMADAFLVVGKFEFFYDQAPESMKSLGSSYALTSQGVGNYLSSFLLSTVARVTGEGGHKGWILNNLNASHLDYYYAFLTVLDLLNLVFFLLVAKFYVYKAEVSDSLQVLKGELE
ncbi:hypothetical protein CsSME_00033799 [Camellia sinensis var. sinensis]